MSQNPSGKDYVAEVKVALDKLRGYAAGRSDDIRGAIDKVGDFVDKQTGGKYAERVDKVQAFAKKQVGDFAKSAAPAASTEKVDPFSLDDTAQQATWQQPPNSPGASSRKAPKPPLTKDDLAKAMTTLREFAASHADDLSGLVDKVGDFVDKQTKGKYSDRVDKVQAVAKEQVGKLKK